MWNEKGVILDEGPVDAFRNSLAQLGEGIGEHIETLADNYVWDNEIIRDIPILKYLQAGWKIKRNICEKYEMEKIVLFIQELDKCVQNEKILQMKEKILSDPKYLRKESELALIALSRFIDKNKSKLLAKVLGMFACGNVNAEEYEELVYVINQINLSDLVTLKLVVDGVNSLVSDKNLSSLNRLLACGVIMQATINANGIRYNDYEALSIGLKLNDANLL